MLLLRHAATVTDECLTRRATVSKATGSICPSAAGPSISSTQLRRIRLTRRGRVVICLAVNFKRDYGLHRIASSHVASPIPRRLGPTTMHTPPVSITADMWRDGQFRPFVGGIRCADLQCYQKRILVPVYIYSSLCLSLLDDKLLPRTVASSVDRRSPASRF